MDKTSLRNFILGLKCHEIKLVIMAVWTVFLKNLTSKMS